MFGVGVFIMNQGSFVEEDAIVAWAGHLFAAVEQIFGAFGIIPIFILVSKKKGKPTQWT